MIICHSIDVCCIDCCGTAWPSPFYAVSCWATAAKICSSKRIQFKTYQFNRCVLIQKSRLECEAGHRCDLVQTYWEYAYGLMPDLRHFRWKMTKILIDPLDVLTTVLVHICDSSLDRGVNAMAAACQIFISQQQPHYPGYFYSSGVAF